MKCACEQTQQCAGACEEARCSLEDPSSPSAPLALGFLVRDHLAGEVFARTMRVHHQRN